MPATIKLKEEFGDALAVVLVESQGADEERFMKFAAKKKWLGRDLMWTRERPFSTGARGLPNFVLLDEEGRVVLKGNPLSMHGQIEDEIGAAIARARKGPRNLPKAASKVRSLASKGQWAKAQKQLDRDLPKASGSDAAALEAEAAELDRRFDAELARATWLLENGHPLRAEELVEALMKGVKGDDALTARTVLEAPEASAEADERGGDGAPFDGLDGPARARCMRFNDVASCMSRATLLEHPLPEVPFGEDAAWAATVLGAGLRIRHEPEAIVRHAHRYGPASAWKRYAQDAAFHRAFHGFRVRPHIGSVLKGWAHELRRDLRHVARHGGWGSLLRAPLLRLAQTLGQYAGGRSIDGAWAAALREGRVQPLVPHPSTDAPASIARTP